MKKIIKITTISLLLVFATVINIPRLKGNSYSISELQLTELASLNTAQAEGWIGSAAKAVGKWLSKNFHKVVEAADTVKDWFDKEDNNDSSDNKELQADSTSFDSTLFNDMPAFIMSFDLDSNGRLTMDSMLIRDTDSGMYIKVYGFEFENGNFTIQGN